MLLRCDVGKKDVLLAEDIFGKGIGELKGKTTAHKAPIVKQDEKIEYHRQLEAYCDIMFVNKRPFLLTDFMVTEYLMANRLKSSGSEDIRPALKKQIGEMTRQGFRVTILRAEGESGIVSDEDTMQV